MNEAQDQRAQGAHPTDRFEAIDLARGIALLGVALVNVHAIAVGWQSHYALDLAQHWGDVIAEYFVGMFFAHRSFPTLAFLFGAGLAFQWSRMRDAAPSVEEFNAASARSRLRARYVALLLLGFANALLFWPGDIVSTYALIALVLLWKWPKTDRRLRGWAVVLAMISVWVYGGVVYALLTGGGDFPSPLYSESSFDEPTIRAALAAHLKEFFTNGFVQVLLPEVWLAVFLGVLLVQTGALGRWLRGESRNRGWFAIGLVLLLTGTAMELYASRRGGWSYVSGGIYSSAAMVLALPLTTVGSVFTWLLLCRAWKPDTLPMLRSFLLAAGRTPLTQFFGQSILFAIVFNQSVIGWHGELGRAGYTFVAIATFFLLAGFARGWLASGRARGPLEMLWMAIAKRLSRHRD